MPEFSAISQSRLVTCDPRLQAVFNEVIKTVDCAVICGFRNEADQNKAFHDGFSQVKWPQGRHNRYPSLAVDVMRYPVDWDDEERQSAFAMYVLDVAKSMGVEIEWGGAWKNFTDRPHFQVSL